MPPPQAGVQRAVAVVGGLPWSANSFPASSSLELVHIADIGQLRAFGHHARLAAVACVVREGGPVSATDVARELAPSLTPLIICVRADPFGLRSLLDCARYPGPLHAAVLDIDVLPRALEWACRYTLVGSSTVEAVARLVPEVRGSLSPVLLAAACCAPFNIPVPIFLRACGYEEKERTLRSRLKAFGWPSPFELLGLLLGVHTAHWADRHGGTFRELAAAGGWQSEISFRNHLRRATGETPSNWRRRGFRRALAVASTKLGSHREHSEGV